MSGIIDTVNWDKLGYALLKPKGAMTMSDITLFIENYLSKDRIKAEKQICPDGIWIRDKYKCRNVNFLPMIKILCTVDVNNFRDKSVSDDIERNHSNAFKEIHGNLLDNFPAIVKKNLGIFLSEKDEYKAVYKLMELLTLCSPERLADFLRKKFFPAFFYKYPSAKIVVCGLNDEYETRFTSIRIGYVLQQYGFDRIKSNDVKSFPALSELNHLNSIQPLRVITTMYSLLNYPNIPVIAGGQMGVPFLFQINPIPQHLPKYPTSWNHLLSSSSDFLQESISLNCAKSNKSKVGHRMYIADSLTKQDVILEELKWVVERLNELMYHLTDPTEFVVGGGIEFVFAYEFGVTIDRLFQVAILSVTSPHIFERKNGLFEIADILAALYDVDGSAQAERFKLLFNPTLGLNLVIGIAQQMPPTLSDRICKIADDIYSELRTCIIDSIWMPGLRQGDKVEVRSRDMQRTSLENQDEFVANVCRAIRNTHHGYLTNRDPNGKRPSRYLAPVTGNTPDSMVLLGCIWMLCVLTDPKTMINWEPSNHGQFE